MVLRDAAEKVLEEQAGLKADSIWRRYHRTIGIWQPPIDSISIQVDGSGLIGRIEAKEGPCAENGYAKLIDNYELQGSGSQQRHTRRLDDIIPNKGKIINQLTCDWKDNGFCGFKENNWIWREESNGVADQSLNGN